MTESTTTDEPSWHQPVGLILALLSGAFIGSSFILKKKGLLDSQKKHGEIGSGHSYLSSPLWWIGLILMAVGEICNFAAYAFVPAILVTPLGALSVVISAILSTFFLKEHLNFSGKIGCFQCVIGATIIVLNAPETSVAKTIPEFFGYVVAPGFLVYSGFMIFFLLYLIYQVSPRYGSKYPIVYISICSTVGSFLVVAIQGFGTAAVYSSSHWETDNQFLYWTTYLLIGFIIFAVISQIHFLNKALNMFSTAIVTPVYYVFFTTMTLVTSAVLFRGFPVNGVVSGIMMVTGFLVIVGGVALLFEYNSQMNAEKEMEKLEIRTSFIGEAGIEKTVEQDEGSDESDDEMFPQEEDSDSEDDVDERDLLEFSDDDSRPSLQKRSIRGGTSSIFNIFGTRKPSVHSQDSIDELQSKVSLRQIAEKKQQHLQRQEKVEEAKEAPSSLWDTFASRQSATISPEVISKDLSPVTNEANASATSSNAIHSNLKYLNSDSRSPASDGIIPRVGSHHAHFSPATFSPPLAPRTPVYNSSASYGRPFMLPPNYPRPYSVGSVPLESSSLIYGPIQHSAMEYPTNRIQSAGYDYRQRGSQGLAPTHRIGQPNNASDSTPPQPRPNMSQYSNGHQYYNSQPQQMFQPPRRPNGQPSVHFRPQYQPYPPQHTMYRPPPTPQQYQRQMGFIPSGSQLHLQQQRSISSPMTPGRRSVPNTEPLKSGE